MTLRCIRTLADKRSAVARYKKGITKQVRKLATELTPDMPVLITPQGDAINIRRRVQQDIEKVLTESVSRIPVAEFAAQTVHATEEVTDVQVKEYFDKHIKPEEEFNPDTYDWNSINDIKI
jgi:ornithine carbamoyltransferase